MIGAQCNFRRVRNISSLLCLSFINTLGGALKFFTEINIKIIAKVILFIVQLKSAALSAIKKLTAELPLTSEVSPYVGAVK